MGGLALQFALVFAGGIATGGSIAWLLRSSRAERELETAEGNYQRKFEQLNSRARALGDESTSLRVNLEATQELALRSKHAAISSTTELETLRDELASMSRTLAATRAERDEYAQKLGEHQKLVVDARRRVDDLGNDFRKSQDFYKSELALALEKRRSLERAVADLESEQASLKAQLETAEAEQACVGESLAAANERLADFDELERRLIALEADNADLRQRLGNPDRDASDTTIRAIGIERPAEGEGDDLTEIVGIGKVFEAMLHDLGIYYFRQIATMGPAELARVNAELREFQGRVENDDWIGQARELHHRKYGVSVNIADAG